MLLLRSSTPICWLLRLVLVTIYISFSYSILDLMLVWGSNSLLSVFFPVLPCGSPTFPSGVENKAEPRVNCHQNLVRAHKMLRPRAQWPLKILAHFNTWFIKDIGKSNLALKKIEGPQFFKVFWSSRNRSFVFNQIFVYGTLMGVDYKSEKKI